MFTPRIGALLSALTLALSAAAVPTAVVSPSAAAPSTTSIAPAVHPNVFEIYDPAITSPKQGDVWTAGAQQTVTWDASQIGADGKNTTATLLLGHQMADDLSEYLDLKHPLATDFPVDAGSVSFTVPGVLSAENYIVVLVGSVSDSGNASPVFTIQNANLPGAPSTLSSSVAAPTPAPSAPVASVVSSSLPAVSSAFTTVA